MAILLLVGELGPRADAVVARHGIEEPTFEERDRAVYVTFQVQIGPTPQVTPQVLALLRAAATPQARAELQGALGLRDREYFRKTYLQPLVKAGLLELTLPDRPRSSRQRFRTTAIGEIFLESEQ